MTIQDNENGKTLRIVKKRHKSPKKVPDSSQNAQQYQNQNNYSQIKRPEKEIDKNEKEKKEDLTKVIKNELDEQKSNFKKKLEEKKRKKMLNISGEEPGDKEGEGKKNKEKSEKS